MAQLQTLTPLELWELHRADEPPLALYEDHERAIAATETLSVYLDRWTSQISGWNVLLSEVIVRGEAVQYKRSAPNCSYYKHRLRVVPSTTSTHYRYAGQWADVICDVIGG